MKSQGISKKPVKVVGTAVTALGLLMSTHSFAFNVTSGITGWWEQVEQANHGLIIATSKLPDGSKTGVIFWAHYDAQGNPTWLLGQGDLSENKIYADLYQVSGVSFMQAAGSAPNAEQHVGELVITFDDCKTGDASFQTGLSNVGAGEFSIQRLTTLAGVDCSGGISDDIPPSVSTERFTVALTPSANFPAANGRALWVLGGGTGTLDIEIDDVSEGDYDVFVGGVNKGSITARSDGFDADADGEIEFHSPQRSYHPLLDFDPRGQSLEIVNASGQVVLSADMPAEGETGEIDYGPVKGERVIKQRLTNNSSFPNAYATAEFEQDDEGYTSFEIDLDNVPAGDYTLRVDTIARGAISVYQNGNETEGELEFYSPARAGYSLLDFDPRGALIEIMDGETALFFADFPTVQDNTAPSPDDDGPGDNDDGVGDDDDGPGDDDDGPGDNDDGVGDDDDGPGDNDDGVGDDDDGPGDNDDGVGDDDDDYPGYNQEIRLMLDNQGIYPNGRAKTEFSSKSNGAEFEVELEGVPEGTYALHVGQTKRGDIRVFTEYDDGKVETEGEIEFSESPDDYDELVLDFNVKGEIVEIYEGSTLIFSGTFPAN